MSGVCLHNCEEPYFCNSMVCEEHTEKLKFVQAKHPTRSFSLFKREELEEWLLCLWNENKAICSFCDKSDCYTCNCLMYIKNKLHKVDYFTARDGSWQPITWEIHEIHLFTVQPFNFYVKIDRTIRFHYLIRKFNFVSCEIVEIQLPKVKKVTKEQKSLLKKRMLGFNLFSSCK